MKNAAAAVLLLTLATPAFAQLADSTAFVDAVTKNDGNAAMALLQKRPQGLLDSRAENGDTALIIALARSDPDWASFLLGKGANPNLPARNGDTPLIVAARVGFDDAVDWLIGLKAKIDDDNRMGETPLIIAVQQHHPEIVRALLDSGANPDKADFTGYSARDHALRDPRARDILKLIDTKKPKAGAAKP